MQHPEFDINGQIVPLDESQGQPFVTPLYAAIILIVSVLTVQFDEQTFRSTYQGTKILLSAGADPNLDFPGCVSPITFLIHTKTMAEAGTFRGTSVNDFKERETYWYEAIALLEFA